MGTLKWSMETFFSKAWEAIGEKVGEKLLDYGLDVVGGVKDLKSTLKKLERSSRSLSAKASDVEEQIMNAERSGKKKRKREVELWLEEVKTIEREFHALANEVQTQGFFRRFLGGDRAVELNDRVQDLVEESRHFGELVLDDFKPKEVKFLTQKLVGEAFQKNVEKIWRLLVTDKMPSIGIYGMGGVGKTTLVKHIYNRILEEKQGCVKWVVVSQEDSIQRLQDEMARLLKVDLSDERDEDKRAARVNGALSQRKNYIIVFDDVWKSICLEKLGDPLRVEGCRLVITTRSLEVCRQIGCREVIEVNTLQWNEAWELFRETLGPETALAPQVEEIAKLVVKECDGLPLGIITLAGSMRGVTAAHSWRNALEELQQLDTEELYEMEDKVFKVLKYSFDRLHHGEAKSGYTKVQRCFLYCSLYPEDYAIPREELIRKFILEELVGKRNTRRAQLDQARAILDKLVNVCLLESIKVRTDACVKMHDLVRDMALKITQGKTKALAGQYLMDIPNDEEWPIDLEMMSLMHSSIREIRWGASPNCPKLSTLLFCRNMNLGSIEDSFFTRIRGLCILNLSDTKIQKLPNSVSDLVSLKALLLKACRYLEYVPDLGKLRSLRELDLTYTNIVEVPQGMEELVNLNWLSLYKVINLKLQRGTVVSKLINLQCLFLPEGIDAPIEEIERLGQLEQFVGRVKDESDFNRLIKFIRNQLDRKGVAVSYDITVGEALINGPNIDSGTCVQNRVILRGSWIPIVEMIMLGELDIRHLALVSCKGLRRGSLSDNVHFNNWESSLETLWVFGCNGIECILTSKQLVEDTTASSESSLFRNLERIDLEDLPDFVGIIDDQVEMLASSPSSTPGRQAPAVLFSSLMKLSFNNCKKMKKLGLRLSDDQLPNLEKLFVEGCDELEVIIDLEEEEESRGGQQLQLVSLPKLKELYLINNPKLKSICKSPTLLKCPYIEEISLLRCHSLERRLPLYFPASLGDNGEPHYSPPSPALREILIHRNQREWWESLEWEHPSHPQLLQPFICFEFDEIIPTGNQTLTT